MRTICFIFALLAIMGLLPSLYLGFHLMAVTGSILIVYLPPLVCVLVICIALRKAEEAELESYK